MFFAWLALIDESSQDFITPGIKASQQYHTTSRTFREEVDKVCELLSDYTIPFFSPRYIGHMNTET